MAWVYVGSKPWSDGWAVRRMHYWANPTSGDAASCLSRDLWSDVSDHPDRNAIVEEGLLAEDYGNDIYAMARDLDIH